MSNLDYESLFIYMSLVFAIGIFIILLYGCGGVAFSGNRVYEHFLEYPTDIKIQIASTFSDYEKKLTDVDEKKMINSIIEKINNDKIGVKELTFIIKELTKIHEAGAKATSTGDQPIPIMRTPATTGDQPMRIMRTPATTGDQPIPIMRTPATTGDQPIPKP